MNLHVCVFGLQQFCVPFSAFPTLSILLCKYFTLRTELITFSVCKLSHQFNDLAWTGSLPLVGLPRLLMLCRASPFIYIPLYMYIIMCHHFFTAGSSLAPNTAATSTYNALYESMTRPMSTHNPFSSQTPAYPMFMPTSAPIPSEYTTPFHYSRSMLLIYNCTNCVVTKKGATWSPDRFYRKIKYCTL